MSEVARTAYVIVFRSRLRPGIEADYARRGDEIHALALTMPGLIAAKDYIAEDGERVAIIEFDSADHLAAWREHPEHLRAQAEGRAKFYSSYSIQICRQERGATFDAETGSWIRS
ncbi:MAG: antibiotic biosynthesis monooxygenase [Kofleriaceae bacterium]